jgi:hypothetical protein
MLSNDEASSLVTVCTRNPIRVFVTGLLKHWWALMSCATFTLLSIYVAESSRSNSWIVTASGVLAVMFFVVAAYRTWSDEHEHYCAETAKNVLPEIKGEAAKFKVLSYGEGHDHDDWACGATIEFELHVCNHRAVSTNITGLKMDGASANPPILFSNVRIITQARGVEDLPPFEHEIEMKRGIAVSLFGSAMLSIEGYRLENLPEIDLSPIKVWLVDGFSGSHLLGVRSGETLVLK